ncbi:serine/threonine-protein kinase [Frankia nepalensis]|uniref:serine/threonine-protein kinase n=1 Tax=Frankia nepalensis TaxID=1836974 RepID=UPI0027DB1A66|nr:serine/threonine-protein kinase [Frankia nepalensis]
MASSVRHLRSVGWSDPTAVGPYKVRALIGEGGMGRVYLARSPSGRLVAVKVVHPELAGDPLFRERFRREVAAARRVAGAFTAPIVDADPDGPLPWLATQYVPGPSLREAVDLAGPLPLDACLRLGAGMLEAIIAVHRTGLTHRDLKPSNVLLAADGPRLIDFGIAWAADQSTLTRVGEVCGTAAYMAPEQAVGGVLGPACDIFSLAAVVVFAATGRDPFGVGDPAALLFRVMHADPDLHGVPQRLRDLVLPCLAKDPARRPAAGQLLPVFAAALGHGPLAWPPGVARLIRERESEIAAHPPTPGPPSALPSPNGHRSPASPPGANPPAPSPPAPNPPAASPPMANPPAAVPPGAGPRGVGAPAAGPGARPPPPQTPAPPPREI